MKKNKHLRQDVKHALESKLQSESQDVNVDIQDNQMTVSGVVDDLADKQGAEEAIKSVAGVGKIENGITVSIGGTRSVTDEDIVRFAEQQLDANGLPVVGIDSHKGQLYLHGQVHNLNEAKQIERALTKIPGVAAINNQLQVPHDAYSVDANIVNEVHRQLLKAGVADGDMAINCVEGRVELVGAVTNEEEVHKAAKAASRVSGVQSVTNHLLVNQH